MIKIIKPKMKSQILLLNCAFLIHVNPTNPSAIWIIPVIVNIINSIFHITSFQFSLAYANKSHEEVKIANKSEQTIMKIPKYAKL